MVLWVFKVNSLTSAAGEADAARTQHPIAHFYLDAVAQAVFEGAMAIVIKKIDFCLNSYVDTSKLWHFIVFMYDGALC